MGRSWIRSGIQDEFVNIRYLHCAIDLVDCSSCMCRIEAPHAAVNEITSLDAIISARTRKA